VSSVAKVDYYWTSSSNNNADFRYVEESISLSDNSGNSKTGLPVGQLQLPQPLCERLVLDGWEPHIQQRYR